MWEKYNFLGKSPTWGLKVVYTLFYYWGKKKERKKQVPRPAQDRFLINFFFLSSSTLSSCS